MSGHANRKSSKQKRPKTKLGIPDLDHSKSAVLDSLRSAESKRGYRHAIDEFIQWYCSEPRLSFNKVMVTRYRMFLETSAFWTPAAPDFSNEGVPWAINSLQAPIMAFEMLHPPTEARVIGGSKAGAALGVEEGGTKIVRSDEIVLPPRHLPTFQIRGYAGPSILCRRRSCPPRSFIRLRRHR